MDQLIEASDYGIYNGERHESSADEQIDTHAIIGMSSSAISGLNLSQLMLARNVIGGALEEAQLTLSNSFIDRNLQPSRPSTAT